MIYPGIRNGRMNRDIQVRQQIESQKTYRKRNRNKEACRIKKYQNRLSCGIKLAEKLKNLDCQTVKSINLFNWINEAI
jgi:hypothetical protein